MVTKVMRKLFWVALLSAASTALAADEPARLRRSTQIEDGAPLGVGRQTPVLRFETITGQQRDTATLLRERNGMVYVMTSTGCPLSIKYGARLAAIEKRFADTTRFVYVNTVRAESQDDMRRQIREYGFRGPYAPDRERKMIEALGARTTTEVFVIDAARTLIYRGAVDDQYGIGFALNEPRRQFLIDALEALKAGSTPTIDATFPPGCLLDVPQRDQPPAGGVTYHGRIARILQENCLDCHRLGGAAPFPLNSYSALLGRLSMIDAVVSSKIMPPWHGDSPPPGESSVWANGRAMSDADRRDLLAWLRSNRPLGRPENAPVRQAVTNTWDIGRPDVILSTVRLDLPETGPMQHERLIVATDFKEDRWAEALEFRQDSHEAIHHALIWLLPPGATLPRTDALPTNLELLGAYSPGDYVIRYGARTARRIPAGSLLLIDLYARPMDLVIQTRLRVGMRFARETPTQSVRALVVAADELAIPVGAANEEATLAATLTDDARVIALMPYMRARGVGVTLDIAQPSQDTQRLLDAPAYDYRWQIRYRLKEPLPLAAGTRLELTGKYDNSIGNLNNPDATVPGINGVDADEEALMLVLEIIEPIDLNESDE